MGGTAYPHPAAKSGPGGERREVVHDVVVRERDPGHGHHVRTQGDRGCQRHVLQQDAAPADPAPFGHSDRRVHHGGVAVGANTQRTQPFNYGLAGTAGIQADQKESVRVVDRVVDGSQDWRSVHVDPGHLVVVIRKPTMS